MNIDPTEIERRTLRALSAIKSAYGTDADEFGATLFVSHHIEELDAGYWRATFGTDAPSATDILDALVLRSDFEDEEDLEALDFTLPGDVTNYVLCVSFDEAGEVENVSMES